MLKENLKKIIKSAILNLQKKAVFPVFEALEIVLEYPKEKNHGDYSSNIALKIAGLAPLRAEGSATGLAPLRAEGSATGLAKKSPLEIAEQIKKEINSAVIKKIEVAGIGFLNFFISEEYFQKQVGEILKAKNKFGELKIGKGEKINVEFISANPTGPLTLGNGRGGFCGDVLANVLNKAGFKAKKEYYINDTGEQIKKLGHSVIGDEQAVYKGEYIGELRKKIKEKDPEKTGEKAAKIILDKMIKPSVKKMAIKFDVWFSEKSLYKKKEIENVLEFLKKKKLTYEKDGALWFKTTQFGDDKDRVLIKESGEKTYIASDLAYLKNKMRRGFKKLIFFWGADHHGYIGRTKAAAEALGFEKQQLNFIMMQLVRLFEAGKEVRMSKRAGIYIAIDELIDEVGLDAARFFFLERSPDTHLNFNLDLAKEKSEKNPVYYIQYAHARICSILKKISKSLPTRQAGKVQISNKIQSSNFKLLNYPAEMGLIKQLIKLPEIIEDTARDYQIQRLPQYAVELATVFHQFYRDCRVITDDKKLSQARMALIMAAKITLKNTLDLMGISAPEKM